MEDNFEKYLANFKKMPLKEKQMLIYDQLKMLAGLTNSFCKEINSDNEIIINNELNDLNKGDYTEDDFAEAIIVLINSIQNSVCDFHLKMSEILDEENA